MRLLKISVQSFRGAPDGAYSFAHAATGAPAALTLVTGEPASGKTSLLHAIAAVKELVGGSVPPPDPARLRRRGATSGAVSATWLLTAEEAASAKLAGATLVTDVALADGPAPLFDPHVRALFSAQPPDPATGKLELFPANRRISLSQASLRAPPADLAAPRLRVSRDPGKYDGVRDALVDLASRDAAQAAARLAERGLVARWEQQDSLEPIRRSLAPLAPWLWLEGVAPRGAAHEVRFRRDDGAAIELADLSESEQQALLFAVVFDRVGLRRAIALVDQPELFIHPGEQVRFLRALEALGADNQIIAATTSRELHAAVEPHQIVHVGRKA